MHCTLWVLGAQQLPRSHPGQRPARAAGRPKKCLPEAELTIDLVPRLPKPTQKRSFDCLWGKDWISRQTSAAVTSEVALPAEAERRDSKAQKAAGAVVHKNPGLVEGRLGDNLEEAGTKTEAVGLLQRAPQRRRRLRSIHRAEGSLRNAPSWRPPVLETLPEVRSCRGATAVRPRRHPHCGCSLLLACSRSQASLTIFVICMGVRIQLEFFCVYHTINSE